MIVEQRVYTTYPGKILEFLSMYEGEPLSIQKRILGRLVGYYRTEIGALNQIVHMWAYEDLLERERRRAELFADERFLEFALKISPLLQSQESKILLPAPFFTPVWQA